MCFWKKKKEKILVKVCNAFPDPNGSHPERARLSNEWCLETHMGQYLKASPPTKVCELHKKPDPIPVEVFPIDNPKPDGIPKLVCARLGLHYMLKTYPLADVKSFIKKLSLAGVDFIRVMGDWESEFTPGPGISAFEREPDNKFNLDRENLKWDESLAELRDLVKPYHIQLYIDLFDNCDMDKGPWAHNVNGIAGIYDPTTAALARFKRFFDRVYFILGSNAKFGLGNELDGDHTDWMMNVVLPLGEYVIDKIKKPFCFSGGDMTAHHLHGLLSPDRSTKYGIKDSCLVRHWMHTPAEMTAFIDSGSDVRCYAYSDDGVFMENLGSEHSSCCAVDTRCCQGTIAQRIAVVRTAWDRWKEYRKSDGSLHENQFDHIEFLPREISWDQNPDTIAQESLDIYPQLAIELWSVDIRRKLPE